MPAGTVCAGKSLVSDAYEVPAIRDRGVGEISVDRGFVEQIARVLVESLGGSRGGVSRESLTRAAGVIMLRFYYHSNGSLAKKALMYQF